MNQNRVLTLPPIQSGNCARWVGITPIPLAYAVEPLIPMGMVTLLTAQGGSGKTLLQQILCACIATGKPFLGLNTARGCAAAIFAEDPDGILHIRQERINESLNIHMEELSGRNYIHSLCGHNAALWKEQAITDYFKALEEQLATIPDLKMLILDNAALLFNGNENDRMDVTGFINALNGMAARLGIAILLSTHTSKSSDGSSTRIASGSTAWLNACRSVLEIVPPKDKDDPTKLILRKANHAETGLEIILNWQDGVLVRAREGSFTSQQTKQRELDKLIFEAVERGWETGQPYSDAPQAKSRYLPDYLVRQHKVKKPDAMKSMFSWIDSGHLVSDQRKSKSPRGLKIAKIPDVYGLNLQRGGRVENDGGGVPVTH